MGWVTGSRNSDFKSARPLFCAAAVIIPVFTQHYAMLNAVQAIRPPQADLGGTVSMRQHDLTPLDLIAGETRRGLAMWTDDRWLARDCYTEVWTVTRIDGFLECDKSLAL